MKALSTEEPKKPAVGPMSESEGDDLEFLSPEESFKDKDKGDQGASPTLRRSSRKRKSVSVPTNMSKNSASKKKKSSPDPGKSMPRIPRTPQGGAAAEPVQEQSELEKLLLAMEGRLTAKIEKASEAAKEAVQIAKQTSGALEDLELKIEATEVGLREDMRESEERLFRRVEEKVKDMVDEQLRVAGFDQDLSAGDLTVRSSVQQVTQPSYAGVLSRTAETGGSVSLVTTKEDRQEAKFWKARRSLRVWPLRSFDRKGLDDFLTGKLKLERDAIEELGPIVVSKAKDPRSKVKDEAIVVFDNKQDRDLVKAKAANLANYGQEAGMRLELPDHLQKTFRILMNLAYDLKQRHTELRRNIKFDEDDLSMYMDVQFKKDGPWRRIKPEQAKELTGRRRRGPEQIDAEELRSLVGEDDDEVE